jgi:hypothetical protein
MRNERTLPTEEELNEYKVQIREKKSKNGEKEQTLFHWPEMPLSEKYASRLLRYRLAKALVGYTTASGRHVKSYGIHVLAALAIMSILIYGESKNPFFGYSLITFIGIFVTFFIVFYHFIFRTEKFPLIQEVRKGEKIPVAIRDNNGKTEVVTLEAKETVTNVFTLDKGSEEFLLPYGVIKEVSSNHTEVWKIKSFHYNMVWGAAMYEDLDVAKLDVWGEVVSWMPYEVEDALARTRKYLQRDGIDEEEIKFVQEKIKEIYAAIAVIGENNGEIEERYGRRIIKIKMNKTNRGFLTAWRGIIEDVEKYHLERLRERKAVNAQEKKIIEMINHARTVEIERQYDIGLMEKRIKAEADANLLLYEKLRRKPDEVYIEQETASRAPDVREASEVVNKVMDEELKKMIEGGLDGTAQDEQ